MKKILFLLLTFSMGLGAEPKHVQLLNCPSPPTCLFGTWKIESYKESKFPGLSLKQADRLIGKEVVISSDSLMDFMSYDLGIDTILRNIKDKPLDSALFESMLKVPDSVIFLENHCYLPRYSIRRVLLEDYMIWGYRTRPYMLNLSEGISEDSADIVETSCADTCFTSRTWIWPRYIVVDQETLLTNIDGMFFFLKKE